MDGFAAVPGTLGRPLGLGVDCTPSLVYLLPPFGGRLGASVGRVGIPHAGSAAYWGPLGGLYLVDSASSHMLVSKIKPCMSKYKQSIP
jgi:hypothetical protein